MEDAIAAYDPETLKAIHTPPKKSALAFKSNSLLRRKSGFNRDSNGRIGAVCRIKRKLFDQQTAELTKYDSLKRPRHFPPR